MVSLAQHVYKVALAKLGIPPADRRLSRAIKGVSMWIVLWTTTRSVPPRLFRNLLDHLSGGMDFEKTVGSKGEISGFPSSNFNCVFMIHDDWLTALDDRFWIGRLRNGCHLQEVQQARKLPKEASASLFMPRCVACFGTCWLTRCGCGGGWVEWRL